MAATPTPDSTMMLTAAPATNGWIGISYPSRKKNPSERYAVRVTEIRTDARKPRRETATLGSRLPQVAPLEQPRGREAEDQAPERRADAKDRHVGHGDQEAHQRAEAEALLEGGGESRLQHPQHRQAG